MLRVPGELDSFIVNYREANCVDKVLIPRGGYVKPSLPTWLSAEFLGGGDKKIEMDLTADEGNHALCSPDAASRSPNFNDTRGSDFSGVND